MNEDFEIDYNDQFYQAYLAGAAWAADQFGGDLTYFQDEETWTAFIEFLEEGADV